jgi:hypothetical protein
MAEENTSSATATKLIFAPTCDIASAQANRLFRQRRSTYAWVESSFELFAHDRAFQLTGCCLIC